MTTNNHGTVLQREHPQESVASSRWSSAHVPKRSWWWPGGWTA